MVSWASRSILVLLGVRQIKWAEPRTGSIGVCTENLNPQIMVMKSAVTPPFFIPSAQAKFFGYPPKAILGTAYELATGQRLGSGDFEGGKSGAVAVLRTLGFTIQDKD